MARLLLLFVLLFTAKILLSQPLVRHDSSSIAIRKFNAQSVEKLKQDKDFQYNRYKEPVQSLWGKFWQWFWYKIGQIMNTKAGRTTVYTSFILLAVAIIVFFITKVVGMDAGRLFGRKAGKPLEYSLGSEDIHEISFDEAIESAISSGNYRQAIRLLYLQTLKQLSDKKFIDWKIDKTNTDYIGEVSARPWYQPFKTLTNKFDFVWYGELHIGKEDFQKLHIEFQKFNNQL